MPKILTWKITIFKWHERFKVQAANNDIKTVNDTDVVFKCSDGYVFVKLVSKQDCAEEGKHMQHCVETYWRKIKSNKCSIFSLRDQQNDPHATIEYNPGYKTIVQIKGKQNKSPIKKYTKYIKEFIAFLKPEITQTLFPYLPFAQVSAYIEDLTSYEVSQIAENESTPIEILSFLSKNEDPYVRAGVVLNSNTPINTVLLLANDEEEVGNSPSQTIGGDTVGEIAKKVLLNRKPKTEEATVNFECLKRLIRNVITEVMSK